MSYFDKILFIGPRSRGGMDAVQTAYAEMMPGARFVTSYKGGSRLRKLLDFFGGYWRAFWLILTCPSIKILHIHTASYNSFWRKMKFANLGRLFGKKVILHIHAGRFGEFMDANMSEVQRAMQKCDGIICLSEQWYEYFAKYDLPNLVSIPNPIDYPEKIDSEKSPSRTHFLFLGVLERQKGVFDLIEAVKGLPPEILQVISVHIAGEGSERNNLKKMIDEYGLSDIVILEGWVSGGKKQELLKESQCFILPSYMEGLPVSILEAMAWGMPIISTEVGGIPSIVETGKNGILFTPGDTKALSSAMQEMVVNKTERYDMGRKSRCVASRYARPAILNELTCYYSKLGVTP